MRTERNAENKARFRYGLVMIYVLGAFMAALQLRSILF